jgi:hypothetical protein
MTASLSPIKSVLLALIATLENLVFEMTTDIFLALHRWAVNPTNLHVFVILSYFSECSFFRGSDILKRIKPGGNDEWHTNLYSQLADSVGTFETRYATAKEVFDDLEKEEFKVLNLINPDTLSEIIRLIESERDSEGRAKYFEKLAEHLPSAFSWIEVPRSRP